MTPHTRLSSAAPGKTAGERGPAHGSTRSRELRPNGDPAAHSGRRVRKSFIGPARLGAALGVRSRLESGVRGALHRRGADSLGGALLGALLHVLPGLRGVLLGLGGNRRQGGHHLDDACRGEGDGRLVRLPGSSVSPWPQPSPEKPDRGKHTSTGKPKQMQGGALLTGPGAQVKLQCGPGHLPPIPRTHSPAPTRLHPAPLPQNLHPFRSTGDTRREDSKEGPGSQEGSHAGVSWATPLQRHRAYLNSRTPGWES